METNIPSALAVTVLNCQRQFPGLGVLASGDPHPSTIPNTYICTCMQEELARAHPGPIFVVDTCTNFECEHHDATFNSMDCLDPDR